MTFMDLCKNRYSTRKFSDKPVEQEKLDYILEAGRIAPTGRNYQPQEEKFPAYLLWLPFTAIWLLIL